MIKIMLNDRNACNVCRHSCILDGSVLKLHVMKNVFLSLLSGILILLSVNPTFAQDGTSEEASNDRTMFSIKAYPFRGSYLSNGVHFSKFGAIHPAGLNMGLELPSQRQRPWQQYLSDPTIGLGLSWIDLGHEMLGHSINLYPYILFDAIDTEYFQLKLKVAGGLSFVTEHWYTQEDQNPDHYYAPTVNTIFGSYINAYLSAGVNMNVPITRYLALGAEFGFFHMSNGRTCMPNIGVNAIYGSVGVMATFNTQTKKTPLNFPDQPYGWALNITGSVGGHKATMSDPGRFLVSSFHAGTVYHVNNWYAIGAGVDVFYNGAVTKNTNHNLYCDGLYDIDGEEVECTTCGKDSGTDYLLKQKFRAGVAMNNEFKFGIITAILDWGVYFYNPYRNLHYDYHQDYHGSVAPERPMFYETTHGASREEAFHYFRLGARCRIWDNVYFQTALKAHLNVAEFIEFGLGYRIPFLKKPNRSEGKKMIFHQHKDWWKE